MCVDRPRQLVDGAIESCRSTSRTSRITNGYHVAIAAACADVPSCRYDGAARWIVVTAADLAHRYDHLSIQGLAKLAFVEWRVRYGN